MNYKDAIVKQSVKKDKILESLLKYDSLIFKAEDMTNHDLIERYGFFEQAKGILFALHEMQIIDQNFYDEQVDRIFKDFKFFEAFNVKNSRGAGRKPVLTDKQKIEIEEMYKEGYSYRSIAETFGVSHMTIKKALEE